MSIRTLTPRQREVVALLAEGLPCRLIAKRLGLAQSTVNNHIFAAGLTLGINEKLQVGLVTWHLNQRIALLEAFIERNNLGKVEYK